MKMCLDVKNSKVLVKDKASSVVVFNGKDYYATTISDLEKPLIEMIKAQNKKIEELELSHSKLEKSTAESLASMAKLIKTLIGGGK